MNHSRNLLVSLLLLVAVVALAACGQSGPLYLPGDPSEVQVPPSQQPATPPQDADEDLEEDDQDEDDQDENGGT